MVASPAYFVPVAALLRKRVRKNAVSVKEVDMLTSQACKTAKNARLASSMFRQAASVAKIVRLGNTSRMGLKQIVSRALRARSVLQDCLSAMLATKESTATAVELPTA
jgi:hypothetical protein